MTIFILMLKLFKFGQAGLSLALCPSDTPRPSEHFHYFLAPGYALPSLGIAVPLSGGCSWGPGSNVLVAFGVLRLLGQSVDSWGGVCTYARTHINLDLTFTLTYSYWYPCFHTDIYTSSSPTPRIVLVFSLSLFVMSPL